MLPAPHGLLHAAAATRQRSEPCCHASVIPPPVAVTVTVTETITETGTEIQTLNETVTVTLTVIVVVL